MHGFMNIEFNNPTCRKYGTEEKTSIHILYECEVLASFKYTYLGSFFLDPEDIRVLVMGGHLELCKSNMAPITWYRIWGTKGLS
jgi:hypothetical protein